MLTIAATTQHNNGIARRRDKLSAITTPNPASVSFKFQDRKHAQRRSTQVGLNLFGSYHSRLVSLSFLLRRKSGNAPFLQAVGHGQAEEAWRSQLETTMPRDSHKQAAEHHEEAAKSHRHAADAHGKDEHKTAHGHSEKAHEASKKAGDSSKAAHSKSQERAKS
jgi:hypothetical protein